MQTATRVSEGTLRLEGPLTLETAGGHYRELTPLWTGRNPPAVVDLSGAGRIDSAGLALLLEWQALAQRRGLSVEFHSASIALVRLARLCGAAELLGIEAPAEGTART